MLVQPIAGQGKVNAEKQRSLMSALQEAGEIGLTKEEAAKVMGVSSRQLDRAIEALESAGAVIEKRKAGSGSKMRVVMIKAAQWDDHLTHEARLALFIATSLVEHAGSYRLAEHLQSLEIFADQHLTEREQGLFKRLKGVVHIQGGVEDPVEPDEQVHTQIMVAMTDGSGPRELHFAYQAAGETSPDRRRVVPYRLTHDVFSGGTFLLAWDLDKKAPRQFRISRIHRAEAMNRPGIIPDLSPMEKAARYQIGGWIGDSEPFEIRLRVRGVHWVRAMEEAPPALPDFRIKPSPDGHEATVTFMAQALLAPTRWLLQFGEAVTIDGPPALQEHVRKVVAGMKRNLG